MTPPLTPTMINQLDQLGMEWQLRSAPMRRLWKTRIRQLKKYKDLHGHVRIPQNYTGFDNLGLFLKYVRQKRRGSSGPPLTSAQITELESLGVEFYKTSGIPKSKPKHSEKSKGAKKIGLPRHRLL